jgi:protein-L-isoaspartate(D-aspartate) O-methyltransferase
VLGTGASAERIASEAGVLLDRWVQGGRPPLRAWRIGLGPAGEPTAPIWVPRTWELSR